MRTKNVLSIGLLFFLCLPLSAIAQETKNSVLDKVKWQQGPSISDLGNEAEIRVPAGYVFANAADTKLLMEAMENIPSDAEVGFIAPQTLEWFLIFEFSDVGYIRDDEKSSLDAEAMLKSIKAGNEAANKEKRKRGWETTDIGGWALPPRYNLDTHNLEWATKFSSKEGSTVNWNTRLLGRNGVMSVTLVSSEEKLGEILPEQNKILEGFSYKSGHKYADFKKGDKVAEFGLAALVLGGTAVAAKTGLFAALWKLISVSLAAFWKLIVVGLAAMSGFFKNLFNKKKATNPN
jgi:uncharacterized membrane-anchored protein